jgi:hypothetical protein
MGPVIAHQTRVVRQRALVGTRRRSRTSPTAESFDAERNTDKHGRGELACARAVEDDNLGAHGANREVKDRGRTGYRAGCRVRRSLDGSQPWRSAPNHSREVDAWMRSGIGCALPSGILEEKFRDSEALPQMDSQRPKRARRYGRDPSQRRRQLVRGFRPRSGAVQETTWNTGQVRHTTTPALVGERQE